MVLSAVKRAKTFAFDLLFPKFCFGCGVEGVFLCGVCADRLYQTVEVQKCPVCSLRNFSGVICASCRERIVLGRFLYAHDYKNRPVRDMVHALKYNSVRELAPVLASFLIRVIEQYAIPYRTTMIVMPIPLHAARRRKRGFNQSELIAEVFSKHFGLAFSSDNLVRVKNTESQVEFSDFKKRRENVSGAFGVRRVDEVLDKRIILIDDVSTSRSTLDCAARALKDAGAKSVWGMVVAKG